MLAHYKTFQFYDFYFVVTVLLALIYYIFGIFQDRSKFSFNFKDYRFKYFYIFCCISIYSYFTYSQFFSAPMWMDEYTHMLSAYQNLIHSAAIQQQPPGGYALTKLLCDLFGNTLISARLTGFIPMFLTLVLALFNFLKNKSFYPISTFLTLIFINMVDLRYIALEGRSVGFGFFGFALYLSSLFYLQKKPNYKNTIHLVFTTFLFLNSVGLQPASIVLLVLGFSFIIAIFKKNKTATLSLISTSIGIFAFIPIIKYIIKVSSSMGKFTHNYYELFVRWYEAISFHTFLKYFKIGFNGYYLEIFLASALIISLIFKLIKKQISREEKLLFSFFLLWVFCFEIGYNLLVNWPLQHWYYTIIYLIIILLLIFQIKSMNNKLKYLFLTSIFIISSYSSVTKKYKNYTEWRPDWNRVYEYLAEKPASQETFVMGHCMMHILWCYNFFIGSEFYNDKNPNFVSQGYIRTNKYSTSEFEGNGMVTSLLRDKTSKTFAIVIRKDHKFHKFYKNLENIDYPDIEVRNFNQFVVIKSLKSKPLQDHMVKFLEYYNTIVPNDPTNYISFILLAWYYHYAKLPKDRDRTIDSLLKLKSFVWHLKQNQKGMIMYNGLMRIYKKY